MLRNARKSLMSCGSLLMSTFQPVPPPATNVPSVLKVMLAGSAVGHVPGAGGTGGVGGVGGVGGTGGVSGGTPTVVGLRTQASTQVDMIHLWSTNPMVLQVYSR